jgi:hypothetical protein
MTFARVSWPVVAHVRVSLTAVERRFPNWARLAFYGSAGLIVVALASLADLDKLRAELESRAVDVKERYWGNALLVVHDLDGNELYFSYPSDEEAPAADKA